MGVGGVAAAVGAAASVASAANGIFGGSGGSSVSQQGPQSSLSPYQQDAQSWLYQILGNNPQYRSAAGMTNPGAYTGANAGQQFAAPLTPQQMAIINSISGNVTNPTSSVNTADQTGLTALGQMLTKGPTDWTSAFNAIAQPMQQTFQSQTLPGIKAALATSAGGVNSGGNVGMPHAIDVATQNLENAEGNAASTLSYNSTQANNSNILQALGLLPAITAAPGAQGAQALSAASLPQATQQQQLTGQYTDYQTQLQAFLNALGLTNQFALGGTQTPGNTIVNPGQSNGLLSFLSGIGQNSSVTNALGNGLNKLFSSWQSDPAIPAYVDSSGGSVGFGGTLG